MHRAVNRFKVVEKDMCTKMFPSVKQATKPVDSEEEEEEGEAIPLSKLEAYRELYHEKFRCV